MTVDHSVEHADGCARQRIIVVDPVMQTVNHLQSYRQRWDCPACMLWKFGEKTKHILNTESRLVAKTITPDRNLARQARATRAGYFCIRHREATSITLITTRKLRPEWREGKAAAVLRSVRDTVVNDLGVTRLTYNELWRPADNDSGKITIDTKKNDFFEVMAIFKRAGIKPGRYQGSADMIVKLLADAVDEGVDFNFRRNTEDTKTQ